MAKRLGGPSISVKLILTTTALIVAIVFGYAVVNVMTIRREVDTASQARIDQFTSARKQLGAFASPLFARAIEQLVVDGGRDADIASLTENTVTQDNKPHGAQVDQGLAFALVLDRNQNVIVHCQDGHSPVCAVGHHAPVAATPNPLAAETWMQAKAAWQAAIADGDGAAVQFELGAGKAPLQVFAIPIFVNAQASAAAALPSEPPIGRQGYVLLGYDLSPIAWFTTAAAQQKSQAASRAARNTALVGILFVVLGFLVAVFWSLRISKPIKALALRADQIARGDLAARVQVRESDEIGLLGANFNFMADQLVVLLEQTAEKAKLEQELQVAKTIQDTLVPSAELTQHGILQFAAHFAPAAQTGGDWWTWHELAGGKVLLVVGDVTGHGVPAAMITAAAKAACDVARALHDDDVTVSRLLEIMNYAIFESAKRKFVMTCFAAVIDPARRTITFANAGHNFPYLLRRTEGKDEFGSLMVRGNRLGDVRESKYETKTSELLTGDILVWYTDGIVECTNPVGEAFGEKRFRNAIKRAASLNAAELRDSVMAEAQGFWESTPRIDDVTMIVGRIL